MSNQQPVSLGLLGQYYAVRHALGQYLSVSLSAIYEVSPPAGCGQDWLREVFEHALQETIKAHPGLGFGPADGEATLFAPLGRIHLKDVIEYLELDHSSMLPSQEDAFLRAIEVAHALHWPTNKPAWRTMVILPKASSVEDTSGYQHANNSAPKMARIHVAFLAHHAIADGLSGLAFHSALMKHFITVFPDRPNAQWPMLLPEKALIPHLVEDSVAFVAPDLSNIQPNPTTPVWGGRACTLPSAGDFKSRIRIITLTYEEISSLLLKCRQMKITLTNLLHGLICTGLTRALGIAPGFRAITPYSLRKFTGASQHEILNHISYTTKYVSGPVLESIHHSVAHSFEEHELLLNLARDFAQDMKAELERFPDDNAWGLISGIDDLVGHCQAQMGKPRDYTYELSNLGAFGGRSSKSKCEPGGLVPEKLMFTQSGMVAGPALGFNCVSVLQGPFTIGITWQEGVVEEALIDALSQDLSERLIRGIHLH